MSVCFCTCLQNFCRVCNGMSFTKNTCSSFFTVEKSICLVCYFWRPYQLKGLCIITMAAIYRYKNWFLFALFICFYLIYLTWMRQEKIWACISLLIVIQGNLCGMIAHCTFLQQCFIITWFQLMEFLFQYFGGWFLKAVIWKGKLPNCILVFVLPAS